MKASRPGRIRLALERLKRLFKKEPPPATEDPYSYVTAPRKPRPYNRGAAAVAELPEE